jgi:16S rRNA (guanine527-N7)-methyltransferase
MKSLLLKNFPSLSENQIEKFEKLEQLIIEWNSKVNLISRKDVENIPEHHILHSLAIAKIISFTDNSRIIDVGTGGGFPGIPLAIMFPNVNFDLVDSIGKKITVVKDIIEKLNLTNVNAFNARAEIMPPKYDFIISRAVSAFPDFVEIVGGLIKSNNINSLNNGIVYLKGGDFESELVGLKNIKVFQIKDFFDGEYFETKKIIYFPLQPKQLKKIIKKK